MPISLATYNIHRCVGRDGVFDQARTIEAIKAIDSDVIALQEVDSLTGTGIDFLSYLARETGLTAIAGPTLFYHTGHYGNAVLTKARVLAVRRFGLATEGREPRGALDLDLSHNGTTFQVVATHLGLRPWERRFQIRRLLEMFRSGEERPTALLGDFNEWLPWGRPLRWIRAYFGRQPALPTFPSTFPLFALDRIWVHPPASLVKVEIPRDEVVRTASDHLPIKVFVDW